MILKDRDLYEQKRQGPTEIRTRVVGFKVQSDSHYTIGPVDMSLPLQSPFETPGIEGIDLAG